jgi:hypothetical protein
VFQLNPWRAWGAVATTVASVSLSIYLIAISPWYLLPLAWAFAGTAWTGVRAPALAAAPFPCMQACPVMLKMVHSMLIPSPVARLSRCR